MSAWTWTFVKAGNIPKDVVDKICDRALRNLSNIWYLDEGTSFEKKLLNWFKMHDEEYDYYVNECGVDPSDMMHEKLEERLNDKILEGRHKIFDLNLVKKGDMDLESYLCHYKVYEDGGLGEPYCVLVGEDIWVKVPEIFRLQNYSDLTVESGIKTVDGLLEYLSEQPKDILYNYKEKTGSNYGNGLTDSLRESIIEYYSRFGDGNFSVHFG